MLLELTISDFAIIERTSIQFEQGLNALTGETGAGKSILLDALGAVLGQRVSSDLVRTGARAARIEALFAVEPELDAAITPLLDEVGIPFQDDDRTLILAREVQSSGRSTARINGRLVTAGTLQGLGERLVDIHGQSDHLAILKTTEQRSMLDRYAGLEQERSTLARVVAEWRAVKRQIASLSTGAQERERRIDLLRFQIDEIAGAGLQPDEDERLAQEREILQNADRLRQDAQLASEILAGDESGAEVPSASSLLRSVEHAMRDLAEIDRGSMALAERATEIVVLADDLARDLSAYLDNLTIDPQRLLDVDERLSLIQSLKRKYGSTIEEIVDYGNGASVELERLTSGSFDIETLESERMRLEAILGTQAAELSRRRAKAATDLATRVETSIAELRMGRSELAIRVGHRADADGIELDGERVHIDESGIDDVEFLIAPSAGETLRPLARIASGGETARIMLALKSILSDVDATPTLVFDEIDVGVGGRSGQVVGEKLWSITGHHQVIVVTHLPQIAAFANHHLKIAKREHGDRIVSVVEELRGDERVDELAAMLDGTPVTPTSRNSAVEMLRRSEQARASAARIPV